MTWRAIPILLATLLIGCGSEAPLPGSGRGPEKSPVTAPDRVVLYRDTLTVEMSDRSFCTGPRGPDGQDWKGRLQGCPHQWPFVVTLPPGRFARLPLAHAPNGSARVELTDPSGAVQLWTGGR